MKNQQANLELSRRRLMQFGAGFIGTTTLASVLGLELKSSPAIAQSSDKEYTPDTALAKLMEGNKRFVDGTNNGHQESLAYLQSISEEQKPFASLMACADSRCPLETIFDRGFGELFVVRDAGNVATPEEIGSLEYGAFVLGTKIIMVMGHYNCGAVQATLQGEEVPGSISSIIEEIEPAVREYAGQYEDKEAFREAVIANVMYQVDRVKQSPVLAELMANDELKVVGGYFDLTTGEVSIVA